MMVDSKQRIRDATGLLAMVMMLATTVGAQIVNPRITTDSSVDCLSAEVVRELGQVNSADKKGGDFSRRQLLMAVFFYAVFFTLAQVTASALL